MFVNYFCFVTLVESARVELTHYVFDTFEFVTTLKYVLITLRRYLFDCMHINGGFFHQ